jgi:hypothetical protein
MGRRGSRNSTYFAVLLDNHEPQAMPYQSIDEHGSTLHDADAERSVRLREVQREHLFAMRRNAAQHPQLLLILVVSLDHDFSRDT